MLCALLSFVIPGPDLVIDARRTPDLAAALRAAAPKKPKHILLRGRFTVRNLEIGPEWNGARFEGADRDATISGGVPIRGWRAATFLGKSVWAANAPVPIMRQLTWGGKTLQRPRTPASEFLRFDGYVGDDGKAEWNAGQSRMRYRPGDLKPWHNLADVEIVCHHLWVTSRLPIAALDEAKHEVTFAKKSVFKLMDDYTGGAGVYRVENVAEALDKPGEFYFDRPTGMVYVAPIPGTKIRDFAPVVPTTDRLLTIRGAKDVGVKFVNFEDSEYDYPAGQSGDPQVAVSVPAAVRLIDCTSVELSSCNVRRVGQYAVSVEGKSTKTHISHCEYSDLGGGGVKVDHGTSDTTVEHCEIDRAGRIYAPAVGIWIGNSSHNKIIANRISNLFYTGISVGWTWGYAAHDGADNLIEGNVITDIGQGELSDMGGIYHLGVAPGTIIRGNRIERVKSRGYGGWGIYLDEGSSNILVEKNTVLHTKSGGFHQHYGRDNLIRSNVFAFAEREGVIIRSRAEGHNSFTIEDNLIIADQTPITAGNWSGDGYVFRNNRLWAGGKQGPLPAKATGNVWLKEAPKF